MNDQILLYVLVYIVLQGALLFFLPKWWKAAACPSLLALPFMLFDLSSSGNLSGLLTLGLTPVAIGWLLLVLIAFGVATASQSKEQSVSTEDEHVLNDR